MGSFVPVTVTSGIMVPVTEVSWAEGGGGDSILTYTYTSGIKSNWLLCFLNNRYLRRQYAQVSFSFLLFRRGWLFWGDTEWNNMGHWEKCCLLDRCFISSLPDYGVSQFVTNLRPFVGIFSSYFYFYFYFPEEGDHCILLIFGSISTHEFR